MGVTTVNEDVLPGHVAGSFREKEQNQVGYFFRLGHALTQRNFRDDVREFFFGTGEAGRSEEHTSELQSPD